METTLKDLNNTNTKEFISWIRVFIGYCVDTDDYDACSRQVEELLGILRSNKDYKEKDIAWIAILIWNKGTEYFR